MTRNKRNECFDCSNKRPIPGDCHIQCTKPDNEMTGNPHGMSHGWFMYPMNFDPVWKAKLCSNFDPVKKEDKP